MRKFKIRCSAIGSITAYPDRDELPKGAVTYLQQWVREQLYSRKKEFTSKYTEKGKDQEEAAKDFAAEQFGWGMVEINKTELENEFMTGTPDLILSGLIPDIKNSFDCFTFPLFETEPNKDYWWQLQGYMSLTGKQHAAVVYCLMDAPEGIIEKEAFRLSRQAGFDELDADFYEQVKINMTYSNLPAELRIKKFDVERDNNAISQIERRVELCREYIKRNLSRILEDQPVIEKYVPAEKITLFKIA